MWLHYRCAHLTVAQIIWRTAFLSLSVFSSIKMCLVSVPYNSKVNHTLKDFLIMIRTILEETQDNVTQFQNHHFTALTNIPFSLPVLVPLIYIDFLLIVYISHFALSTSGSSFLGLSDLLLTILTLSNSLYSTTDSFQGTIKTKWPFRAPEALLQQKLNGNLGVSKDEWIYFWKN